MIQTQKSLKTLNTFGVDAKAKLFAIVNTVDELKFLLENPKIKSEKLLFLGGGSNILFTQDFDGCIIQLNLKGIDVSTEIDDHVLVTANAGENWHEFVQLCTHQDFGGLENLSLIPGNVGTSPMQNIGAYGTEIKDVFESCKVIDINTLEIKNISNAQCEFGYRDSIFKQKEKGRYIILSVTFRLTTNNHKIKTEYGAIQSELHKMKTENPTIQNISDAVIAIRQSKLPDPNVIGNAGSFFKNPTINKIQYESLQRVYPNIPGYPTDNLVKVPAGWLIEQSGWKGKQIGNVATHHLQALVIINKTGNASGQEIFDFSSEIIKSVKETFGIELEREVNII